MAKETKGEGELDFRTQKGIWVCKVTFIQLDVGQQKNLREGYTDNSLMHKRN
jgi:hypothetical protein